MRPATSPAGICRACASSWRNAQTASIIAMLLGVGAVVGGAARRRPAPAIRQRRHPGPQEMIRRSLLSYMRAQEEQADRAGVKFLAATGQSAKGMYETFKRFADEIHVRCAPRRSLSCSRIRCRPNASRALEALARRARTGTRRIRPSCKCVTT